MDELDDFLKWFLAAGLSLGKVPVLTSVNKIGGDGRGGSVMSGVWYRNGNFQVELFMISGPLIIPEHSHPNVDSYEVLLGGQIRLSRHGKWLLPETYLEDSAGDGTSLYKGYNIRVNHNDLHGGLVGPGGAMFFSVQHWLNGVEPHSVAYDWNGYTATPDQLKKLKFGAAAFKENKTTDMAASSGHLQN